jgi:hypothetical protein
MFLTVICNFYLIFVFVRCGIHCVFLLSVVQGAVAFRSLWLKCSLIGLEELNFILLFDICSNSNISAEIFLRPVTYIVVALRTSMVGFLLLLFAFFFL